MKPSFASSRPLRQRGLSFIGLLLVGVLVIFGGVVLAQLVPTYVEYMAIDRVAKKAASEGASVEAVREVFDKGAQIEDIKSIKGSDLDVFKEGGKVVVRFEYTREIHIAGPAYLVMKYNGQTK